VRSAARGVVAVDPFDSDIVDLAGGSFRTPNRDPFGLLGRSVDGGASVEWVDFDEWITGLSFSQDGSRFWLATMSGNLMSLDRAESWQRVASTPNGRPLVSLSVSPYDSALVWAITEPGELWVYHAAENGLAVG